MKKYRWEVKQERDPYYNSPLCWYVMLVTNNPSNRYMDGRVRHKKRISWRLFRSIKNCVRHTKYLIIQEVRAKGRNKRRIAKTVTELLIHL